MGILTTEEHALMVSQVVKNAVADERARIVAMLRLAAENDPNARCSILDLADEIEMGGGATIICDLNALVNDLEKDE